MKQRSKTSHKGQNGKVLIIGGSKEYVGALALAGLACLRVGADYVLICAPQKVAWAINCLTPDLITKKFKGHYFTLSQAKEITKLAKDYDVILIGNGIGTKSDSFVKQICKIKKPKVIDADAIKACNLKKVENSILTPHQIEFEKLLKNSKLTKQSLIKHLQSNVILLKGHVDKIYSKKKVKENHTGNPGMTKAGTGDVLAGLAAGFLSQGHSLKDAAYHAAFYNGKLADALEKKQGYSYLASDIVNDIKRIA
tara:strand:- start:1352 stop:2110 length:759 start_codon:yes stop_codon:yes gene_type:complete